MPATRVSFFIIFSISTSVRFFSAAPLWREIEWTQNRFFRPSPFVFFPRLPQKENEKSK